MKAGPWRFLLYIVLPQPAKMTVLPDELRGQLDRINLAANVGMYSGQGATAYDATHRYAEAEHHEYPAQQLVEDVWPGRGYGHALELGAGSGYFTRLIARRAAAVTAVEPVPDMQRVLRQGCEAHGIGNVEAIQRRLENYHRETEPLIEYYRVRGNLVPIHGNRKENEVFAEIQKALEQVPAA